jgi:hypothetical protein
MVAGMKKDPVARVGLRSRRNAHGAAYEFKVEVDNYDDVRMSLTSVAPVDIRAVVIVCYVSAFCGLTFGFVAGAVWASLFASVCFALGCSVEAWVWKHIARRYAMTAFTLAQGEARRAERGEL